MSNIKNRFFLPRWAALAICAIATLVTAAFYLGYFGDHNKHEGISSKHVFISYNGEANRLYGHVQVTPQPGGGLITVALTPERTVTLQVIASPTAAELVLSHIDQDPTLRYEPLIAQPVAGNADALQVVIPPGFYLTDAGLTSRDDGDYLGVYLALKKGDPDADYEEASSQPELMVGGTFEWSY